jgi:hypothetical protein
MKMIIKLLLVLGGMWFSGNASATFLNGDFETGDLTGWTATPPFFTTATHELSGLTAVNGNFFAALNGFVDEPANLRQEVFLSPGYKVSFHFGIPEGGNPNGAFFIINDEEIALAGEVGEWRHFEYLFEGIAGIYDIGIRVKFLLIEVFLEGQWIAMPIEGLGFAGIDNVVITPASAAVPEPGTWLLLLLGTLALFTIRRNSHSFLNKTRACAS